MKEQKKILKTHTASVEAKIQKPLLRISKEFIKVVFFFCWFWFFKTKIIKWLREKLIELIMKLKKKTEICNNYKFLEGINNLQRKNYMNVKDIQL